jgi:nitroreductase
MSDINLILSRRSIRHFLPDTVPGDVIEQVLRAAMSAPSAGNQQPWHFVVITDCDLLNALPALHPYAQMAAEAPVAILVCGDPSLERHKGFWVQDCAAATQNMLLAAHALGLGAVWTGVYPVEERVNGMADLIGCPDPIVPFALVPMGYPVEPKGPSDRYSTNRIHRNHWSD